MIFKKETAELTKEECDRIESSFSTIPNMTLKIHEEREITFEFQSKDFLYTMLDGKVTNVLSNVKSNSSCRFCKAAGKDMNDIEKLLQYPVYTEWFKYGLCPL